MRVGLETQLFVGEPAVTKAALKLLQKNDNNGACISFFLKISWTPNVIVKALLQTYLKHMAIKYFLYQE